MTRLSVIIPALNEANSLPGLLAALRGQTRPPDEIIVADAGSTDNTRALAEAGGARVVPGGRPGPGRNAGARAATGDLLLFLDSDVMPAAGFIAAALAEFQRDGYAVATTLIAPMTDSAADQIIAETTNLYLQVVQHITPHAPGFCILCQRAIHEAIGGFDEKVKLGEDHDYVQRAAQRGEFGVLTHVRIPVSMRRVEKEGLAKLAFKYMWCEMYALSGKPIYSTPFEYEFGAFAPAAGAAAGARERRLIDIGQLREQLGHFENPLDRLNVAGRARLDRWLQQAEEQGDRAEAAAEAAWERFRLQLDQLDAPDLDRLNRYLHRRRALIRRWGQPLRETVARWQTRPPAESIRVKDTNWLRWPWRSQPGTGPLPGSPPPDRQPPAAP
jgi:glycosyltransferase involved in cell wall biosynthesis